MSITIRKTQPKDINFIKKLEMNCSLSEWSKLDYLLEIKREDSIFLTAHENTEPAGFLLARIVQSNNLSSENNTPENGIAEIYNIAISHKLRQKGIGI